MKSGVNVERFILKSNIFYSVSVLIFMLLLHGFCAKLLHLSSGIQQLKKPCLSSTQRSGIPGAGTEVRRNTTQSVGVKHWLEWKRIRSGAVPDRRRTADAFSVNWGLGDSIELSSCLTLMSLHLESF